MPFYFLPGKSQSGLDIPLNQELIEKGELLFLLSLLLCSFIAFFILLLHLCDQLQRNTTSLWCSAQMTAVCSTASGSPSWTGSSPAVDREALPQSQWWSPVSGRAQRRWVCVVTEAFDRFVFFSFFSAFRLCVRSRCWDACMVVDGGTSFEFNDGAIATISMSEEDQLRTVVLENWDKSEYLSS